MTTTPTNDANALRYDFGAFIVLATAVEKYAQTLQYIRDMRDLLGPYVSQEGPGFQAYRDRWSKLCRELCDEHGRPRLTVVQGGGTPPVRKLAIFDSEPA